MMAGRKRNRNQEATAPAWVDSALGGISILAGGYLPANWQLLCEGLSQPQMHASCQYNASIATTSAEDYSALMVLADACYDAEKMQVNATGKSFGVASGGVMLGKLEGESIWKKVSFLDSESTVAASAAISDSITSPISGYAASAPPQDPVLYTAYLALTAVKMTSKPATPASSDSKATSTSVKKATAAKPEAVSYVMFKPAPEAVEAANQLFEQLRMER